MTGEKMVSYPNASRGAALRPAVAVATVYDDDAERVHAYAVGAWLYELLVRPHEQPLAFGGGVRVFPGTKAGHVDTALADLTLLVRVFEPGTEVAEAMQASSAVRAWRSVLGDTHVVGVATSERWPSFRLREALIEAYAERGEIAASLTRVLRGLGHLMCANAAAPKLYVSYSERDVDAAGDELSDLVEALRALEFFHELRLIDGGDDGSEVMHPTGGGDHDAPPGMLLVLNGDSYGHDGHCPAHLLVAKRRQCPVLVSSAFEHGDRRSPAYLGNTSTLARPTDPRALAQRVLVEWIRAEAFRRDAVKGAEAVELPSFQVLTRSPELVDLQSDANAGRSRVLVYPDPPLSAQEEDTLRIAAPRLRLVTPTNVYRALPTRSSAVESPLQQLQVALSVSDSLLSAQSGGDGSEATEEGVTRYHLDDALVHLARSLISAGAAIAYGGDFRREADEDYQGVFPRGGYVEMLAELVRTYDRTGSGPEHRLHSYVAAVSPADRSTLPGQVHDLAVSGEGMLQQPSSEASEERPLYYSDMRRVMASTVDACVVMGGQSSPRKAPGGAGYGGLYPGVLEEVWQMLHVNPETGPKPLYVCGGFDGAGAIAARWLRGQGVEEALEPDDGDVRRRLVALSESPLRKTLGIPKDRKELAEGIAACGARVLASDAAAVAWNGLTLRENELLMRTRDPVVIAQLVLRGLFVLRHQRTAGQLSVELVRGSVTHAQDLDLLCLPYCKALPMGGAAAAFADAVGGWAGLVKDSSSGMIPLSSDQVAPHWLRLVPLTHFAEVQELAKEVREGTREVVRLARRYAFSQIGLVTFGGSAYLGEVVGVMLEELRALAPHTQVVWFESNVERFQELKDMLGESRHTALSTRWLRADAPAPRVAMPNVVSVQLADGTLNCTVIPAQGTSIAPNTTTDLGVEDVARLGDPRATLAPSPRALGGCGRSLARKLFSRQFEALRSANPEAQWLFVHDAAASSLHYESLGAGAHPLALEVGVRRKLSSSAYGKGAFTRRTRGAGPLRILLVVDPKSDLPHACREADVLRRLMENFASEQLELTVLGGATYRKSSGIEKAATLEHVMGALQRADVLHYCGHAYFNGDGPDASGLTLEDADLTAGEIGKLSVVPRVAVVNACEAGRIRGHIPGSESASFAGMFLRAGVVAYVGTLWPVQDDAASVFAKRLYHSLAVGLPLDEAVRRGRKQLYDEQRHDWSNYVLYGDAEFVLDL